MNTIDRLERSVHAMIESHECLRSDIEKNAENTSGAFHEQEEARETIENLQHKINELEKSLGKSKEIELKKSQIKDQINKILDKLNKFGSINKIANV